ncbi:MAG: ribonuclease D [Alphaproteobacteria bacterium]|nr:ribonuclease D [Alphaproteobacteria bacterium]
MVTVITSNGELAEACTRFASAPYVAIDTEFMRDTTYWPKLCLLQAAIPGFGVVIDPLAPGLDLAPLYDLFRSPTVVKVFHAARQDLEIFFHQANVIPAPLFDTQVAAMVCGFGDSAAYETLVRELAHAQIDKSSRFTDWSRRPLSDKQLTYALSDVTHLCRVYESLKKQLDKSGRSHWLEEELDVLRSPETYELKPEESWRRLKMRGGNRRFTAVLMEISAWRERLAQERDVPRSRVMKDEALFEIAAQAPQTTEDLDSLRGIPRGFASSRAAHGLTEAVKTGLALPASAIPDIDRGPPPAIPPVLGDMMRVLLKIQCEAHGVAQKLIASSSDLDQIAADDKADVPALQGWRREIFGSAALELKHGRIALSIRDRKAVVVAVES